MLAVDRRPSQRPRPPPMRSRRQAFGSFRFDDPPLFGATSASPGARLTTKRTRSAMCTDARSVSPLQLWDHSGQAERVIHIDRNAPREAVRGPGSGVRVRGRTRRFLRWRTTHGVDGPRGCYLNLGDLFAH
jgi:hypothetical protein